MAWLVPALVIDLVAVYEALNADVEEVSSWLTVVGEMRRHAPQAVAFCYGV